MVNVRQTDSTQCCPCFSGVEYGRGSQRDQSYEICFLIIRSLHQMVLVWNHEQLWPTPAEASRDWAETSCSSTKLVIDGHFRLCNTSVVCSHSIIEAGAQLNSLSGEHQKWPKEGQSQISQSWLRYRNGYLGRIDKLTPFWQIIKILINYNNDIGSGYDSNNETTYWSTYKTTCI